MRNQGPDIRDHRDCDVLLVESESIKDAQEGKGLFLLLTTFKLIWFIVNNMHTTDHLRKNLRYRKNSIPRTTAILMPFLNLWHRGLLFKAKSE